MSRGILELCRARCPDVWYEGGAVVWRIGRATISAVGTSDPHTTMSVEDLPVILDISYDQALAILDNAKK